MFLKEILMCFQFEFPLLNKLCRIKKNNQIKIKLLLMPCVSVNLQEIQEKLQELF